MATRKKEDKIMYDVDGERLYTIGDVAKMAGVSKQAVFKWINHKKNPLQATYIPALVPYWQVRQCDLEEYLAKRKQ